MWAKFWKHTDVTAAISPRRVPRGKARGRLSRLEKHNTSQPPEGGGVPSADCLHRRVRKKYIFSLRAGNNYVVEHAKRYLPFLQAITRKESFDQLVERKTEGLPSHQLSGYSRTFSIILFFILWNWILSIFANDSFKITESLLKDNFLIISRKRERGREGKEEARRKRTCNSIQW